MLKVIKRERTTAEVAAKFGVSGITVLKWRQKGCPYDTVPMDGERSTRKRMLYNYAEVKAWRKDNMFVGRPPGATKTSTVK